MPSERSPWVLVTREPTEEMLANTVDDRGTIRVLDFTTPDERSQPFLIPRYSYRAMVAASPSPLEDEALVADVVCLLAERFPSQRPEEVAKLYAAARALLSLLSPTGG